MKNPAKTGNYKIYQMKNLELSYIITKTKMYLTADQPQMKRQLVKREIDQSVENIHKEEQRGGKHKRHMTHGKNGL